MANTEEEKREISKAVEGIMRYTREQERNKIDKIYATVFRDLMKDDILTSEISAYCVIEVLSDNDYLYFHVNRRVEELAGEKKTCFISSIYHKTVSHDDGYKAFKLEDILDMKEQHFKTLKEAKAYIEEFIKTKNIIREV